MISGGVHRVAGGERVLIECDVPGCPTSFYLPPGNGGTLYDARTLATGIGWQVERYKTVGPLAAHCPSHAVPGGI